MARAVIVILALLLAVSTKGSEASHEIKLPGVPDTQAIHNLWTGGEFTFCLDPGTSAYPNFRKQVNEVNAEYTREFGVAWREVPYGTLAQTGCEVAHTSPGDSFCSGCAANISYANWQVVIRYKLSLGFVHWNGTIGHELGHLFGLHEQYKDFGSIQCTYRTDTVMDCGSHIKLPPLGIWFPQWLDIQRLRLWLVPPQVASAGIAYHEGRPFTWYCGGDPHPARSDLSVIMYYDPNGAFYWSGITTPIARGGDGCQRVYVYCYPGRQFYVNQQASGWEGVNQIWYLRNDTLSGACV